MVGARPVRHAPMGLVASLAFWAVLIGRAGAGGLPPCPGDCDGNRTIGAQDLQTSLHAMFDGTALAGCPSADVNGSGAVTAAELLQIVRDATDLSSGCARIETPVPTVPPTATATRSSTATATTPPTRTPTRTPTATPSQPASVWTTLAPLADGPRQEIGVAALGNLIYVTGGLDDNGLPVARVEVYDIGTDDWMTVADLPRPLHHIGAGNALGHVYSIGGLSGLSFTPVTDVYRYDTGANRWDSVAPLPTARGALAVAALDGKLYAIGGSGPSGSVARHDVYDPTTNNWTRLADLPTVRNHLAAAAINGRIYAVGGRAGSATNSTAELDRYDPTTNQWTVLASMPTGRSGLAAAAVNGQLVAIGGEANPQDSRGIYPQVELYDPGTDTWRSLDPMPVPRHGIGAVTVDGRIYVPGGATRAGFEATAHHDALQILDAP